ncbi:two-component system, CitB family, sensor kinase/two-component system, CitB family, sensor histidine kinase DcuS [Desulfocicer vacuolatum DSM 3385]|uniref:histidine kinase n=1 Tax=Desulfocicer vacuolatum DSM 3385 TaxID=1121400 RepID=A0A1W2C0J5_9BACT|nr:sensor histidine kinase [Desulfocicer vacuolatum]SMC78699.1 two-component system, CitB family, sensor kinase/two-component system, CitB family, sensor histidine kinase DcuS [Desulfocicer vacuolatum DSM 3385]
MLNFIKWVFTFFCPVSLQGQMRILVSMVVIGQLFISGAIFATFIGNTSKAQINKRALDIGHTVASVPLIHRILESGDDPQGSIQQFTETVRRQTGAEFVVVADRHSRRFSHPNPEKIGQYFVGGDENLALTKGQAYVSEAIGTLGPSLRSIVPVFNSQGSVIGFVAVGYLQREIMQTVQGYQREPATLIFMLFVVVLLGATGISGYVKRQTLGLEPRQIASLYLERQAILESIQTGIVAVDGSGNISLINQVALKYFGFESDKDLIGKSSTAVFAHSDFSMLLNSDAKESFREIHVDGQEFLFTSVPIAYSGNETGVVASFRPIEDLYRLQKELRQTRQFSEMLRVQAHEYSNKLHTLAGLLQMEAYKEALDLVTRESSGLQSLIQFLSRAVPNPTLAAIIMGKYNRALEMKVEFLLNPDSTMGQIPGDYDFNSLVTILGNLIDNALEAALCCQKQRSPCIQLFMTDIGHDLIFEIEDSGPGVPLEIQDKIFSKAYSSKTSNSAQPDIHGVGLYLVHRHVEYLNGDLILSTGDLGGALFTLILPKKNVKKA